MKKLLLSILTISTLISLPQSSSASSICSCQNYYGIKHTCYYSSYSDPDRSCRAKCIREANQ